MTGWRLTSSIPAMMRSLSSCFEATRMWRKTERARLEKKPSIRLSQEPCLGVKVDDDAFDSGDCPHRRFVRVANDSLRHLAIRPVDDFLYGGHVAAERLVDQD